MKKEELLVDEFGFWEDEDDIFVCSYCGENATAQYVVENGQPSFFNGSTCCGGGRKYEDDEE